MRGAYLKPERNLMCWEQRFTVSLARAIAALQLLPSARCLTHTSAALVQGLAMWTHEPDVYIAVPSTAYDDHAASSVPLPRLRSAEADRSCRTR